MEPIDTTVGTNQPPIQPAPAPATREFNRLTGRQTQQFYNHIEHFYPQGGNAQPDADFLETARKYLNFPVTMSNLLTALEQLGIENNEKARERRLKQAVTKEELEGYEARMHGKYLGLGDQLAHLNARIENLEEAAKKQSERMSAMEVSHG